VKDLEMRRISAVPIATLSRQIVATAAMLSLGLMVSRAQGAIVPVINPSFESPTTADFTTGVITGWTLSSPINQGVFKPSAFPSVGMGTTDGAQTAFLNTGFISQILPSVLTVNNAYTLRVDVGDRADLAFPGYAVQFFAGTTLLAQESSLVPNNGFLTSTINFTALPGNPNLGQPLQIRLVSNGVQVNFDNVRLDAVDITVVPVPASAAIWGLGALGLGLVLRRRKFAA
jgi:hypothetical protein